MSTSKLPAEREYDPVKNPRPEDLHAYGIGTALIWFSVLFAFAMIIYWVVF